MKKGYLYVLLAAVLWGTLPAACRFIYSMGGESVTSAAARAYIASIVFVAIFLINGSFKKIKLKDIPFYIVYGIAGVGGTFLFYMLAVERLSTAMASILLYTAPAFVIIFSRIFFKEKITPVKLFALFGTLLGLAFVVRVYDTSSFVGNLPNILIGLASGICYSLVTILGKIAKNKAPANINSGLMIIFGTLVFLPFAPPHTIPIHSAGLMGGYIYLAIFGSVLPYIFYLKGLDCGIDGGYASVVATIEPVVATAMCAAVFQERIEPIQVVGIIIVLISIMLAVTAGKEQNSTAGRLS